MTKITKLLFRAMGIILMFLWSLEIEAQTANTSVLTWDQEVGCIKYDDEVTDDPIGEGPPGLAVNLMEGMEDGNCLRFCENSHVNFTLQSSTISTVQWQVSGGNIINNSNTDATIQWGSSGNGSLSITITYTDNSVKTHTICVEKIISPNAYFEIDGINPYQTQFCVDTPISFNNLSIDNGGTAIVNYFWDFGNGSYSNSFEPTYAYHNSGNYKVSLTVTNSCNCSATFEYDIQVDNALPVEIICQNVTCEGMVESYSSSDGCSGDWDVIGGSIIGGGSGSPTIDVLWDQVDPEEGFGYVSYKSHCGCPYWTTVKIPVVIHDPIIKGPDIICEGKQGRFSLPQWPTTDFKWDIDGDPTHPMMVYTDQRNEIIVDGAAPGIYVLRVKYQNTLLGTDVCGGYAEIVFEVVESVKVITSASSTFCAGITESFTTSNGQPVIWKVTMGDNSYEVYGPTLNYLFDQGGTYVITATYNGCESDPVIIEVIPTPVISADGISGPDKVCLDVPYIYTVNDGDPNAIFVWSVTGGDVIGSNAGNEVAIAFNAPTATVSVVKQYVKNGVICTSVPVTYNVNQLVVNPTIVNNEGLSIFCTSDTYTFTADMHGVVADHMEWEIVGMPGNTDNFGSIINGIFENTVTVGINEITGGVVNGELRLYVTKCGDTNIFIYPITLKQLPDISFTTNKNEYCPGEGVEFTVMTTGVPGITSGNINIYVDGNLKASTAYNNGVPTAPVFNLFDNITDDNVQRLITVEYDGGCKFNPRASQPVIVFPQTRVTLSSPQRSRRVCDSPQLYATLSIGITQTTEFHWYLNGTTSVGGNSDILTINSPGTYHVEVKDKNGCWAISDTVTYVGCSDPDPGEGGPGGTPCTVEPNPALALTASMDTCDEITASVANYTPGTINWFGSEHVTVTGGQGTPNATYSIDELGFHWVKVAVNYGSCSVVREQQFIKYYEAGLKAKVSCNGDGSYTVILENNSRVHDPGGITVNYEYLEGLNSLGNGPGSITLNNVLPGIHTYTIQLTSSINPMCEESITLNLPDEPNVDFMVPAANSEYCSDEPVLLKIQDFNPENSYQWVFDGTSFKTDQEETLINFADAGSKSITLKATGPYGCTYETSAPVNITINKAEFFGSVTPPGLDFCEGSTVTPLSFNPTNPLDPMPTNAIWMHDDEQVATGLNFIPTESGSYWPVLINGDGCKFYGMAEKPVIVKVRKPPFASINGNTSVCFGESTTLTGIYTDPAIQHRWTLNGNALPGTLGSWITGPNDLTLTLSGLTPGSYTYAFETRDPADPSCVNSFEAVVVFHPQLTTPSISVGLTNCQPYTLGLSASGPAAGTYVWSNGMTGQSIEVTHGGAYSVTYTAPTGCSVTGYIQAPHNPERTLWVVPQGCYSICASTNPYLLAPLGVYEQYEWFVNGWVSQSGSNTFVPNIMVNQTGDYQLAITQFGCTFYSSKPQIDVNFGCRMINGVMQAEKEIIPAVLKLSPNPTTESTTASYEVGSEYRSATSITIHDVSGVQRLKINVSGTEGQVNLNVGHLSPGTYLVNLQADGQNIAQQKLIKK